MLSQPEYLNVLNNTPSEPWETIDKLWMGEKKYLSLKKYTMIFDYIEKDSILINKMYEIIRNDNSSERFSKEWKKLLHLNFTDLKKIVLGKNEYSYELRVSSPYFLDLLNIEQQQEIKSLNE